MTVFVTVWLWPFDLCVNAWWVTAIEYVCTKFGVDSPRRFPFRAWTNKQTWLNTLSMPAAIQAWVIIVWALSIDFQRSHLSVRCQLMQLHATSFAGCGLTYDIWTPNTWNRNVTLFWTFSRICLVIYLIVIYLPDSVILSFGFFYHTTPC